MELRQHLWVHLPFFCWERPVYLIRYKLPICSVTMSESRVIYGLDNKQKKKIVKSIQLCVSDFLIVLYLKFFLSVHFQWNFERRNSL